MNRKILSVIGILIMCAAVSFLVAHAERSLFPQPEPKPAPPPSGPGLMHGSMAWLSQTQHYSSSRVSSYQRQGGPRDNYYIPTTGEEITLAEIEGPGAITHIWATHPGGGHDLVVRMYWEGNQHPR